jgi:peptidoglycan/xylan/chitin deacetylase (PgdA/CDA1 family)
MTAGRTALSMPTMRPRHRRLGPEIKDPNALPYACLGWPMNEKDGIVDEIWRSAEMPAVDEFMQQYRPYMDWDDLRTWITQGHSVGLHTRTHPFCSKLSAPEIEYEIVDAAAELRAKLDLDSVPFAYPFGDRLASAATEEDIAQRADLCCMLGIGGISRLGTPSSRLERIVGPADRPLPDAARLTPNRKPYRPMHRLRTRTQP